MSDRSTTRLGSPPGFRRLHETAGLSPAYSRASGAIEAAASLDPGGQPVLRLLVAAALLMAAVLLPAAASAAPKVLRNTDLVALNPAPGPTIAGVLSGGAPWLISHGSKAKLDADGEVKVEIHGLVFAATGTTTSPTGAVISQVKASVACDGVVVGTTGLVSISASGDAVIRDTVPLPSTCGNPIVLVQVPAGRWIAVAGL
jgi:hypothetical protein